jgi:hypothetical protein
MGWNGAHLVGREGDKSFMALHRLWAVWALALVLLVPSIGSAGPLFAVWLDGNTTPGGGGNGIPFSLTAEFGEASVTLVTTEQLETAGFLNGFDAVVISRFGNEFGKALSTAAVTNIQNYVGKGANQGGVAVFTNDAADSLCNPAVSSCPANADPYDPNLNQLFINSSTLAAATHHGYIGELNGAIMAMTSNSAGFLPAIGLLPGSSTGVIAVEQKDPTSPVGFIYEVGPIGAGHPIDAKITFPFTTKERTLFLGYVTGFDSGNVVDQYGDNGLDLLAGVPAIVANTAAIGGENPPPPSVPAPPSLVLVGLGLAGLAAFNRVRRNRSLDK